MRRVGAEDAVRLEHEDVLLGSQTLPEIRLGEKGGYVLGGLERNILRDQCKFYVSSLDLALDGIGEKEVCIDFGVDDADRPVWSQNRRKVEDQRDYIGDRSSLNNDGEVGMEIDFWSRFLLPEMMREKPASEIGKMGKLVGDGEKENNAKEGSDEEDAGLGYIRTHLLVMSVKEDSIDWREMIETA